MEKEVDTEVKKEQGERQDWLNRSQIKLSQVQKD